MSRVRGWLLRAIERRVLSWGAQAMDRYAASRR
jgi:hypothetical protein